MMIYYILIIGILLIVLIALGIAIYKTKDTIRLIDNNKEVKHKKIS